MDPVWQLAFVVLVLFVLAEALALLALGRAIGELQLVRTTHAGQGLMRGLALGSVAPRVAGHAPGMQRDVSLDLGNGGRWILVFATTTCSACRDLINDIGRTGIDRRWGAGLVLMIAGAVEQVATLGELVPEATVLVDTDGTAQAAYAVDRVPFAFLISDGRIEKAGFANTAADLSHLAAQKRVEAVVAPSV